KIRRSLMEGNTEDLKNLIKKEEKRELFISYISDLLLENEHDPALVVRIFINQLIALSDLSIEVSKKKYFGTCAQILNGKLGQDFYTIPVDILFARVLSNKNFINTDSIPPIIQQYITALANESIIKSGHTDFAAKIVEIFLKYPKLINKEQQQQIYSVIEQKYATNSRIIKIFNTYSDQKTYISKEALTKFVKEANIENTNLELNNYGEIILNYKSFIL